MSDRAKIKSIRKLVDRYSAYGYVPCDELDRVLDADGTTEVEEVNQ